MNNYTNNKSDLECQWEKRKHRIPNNKIHGANIGPTWVLSAPDGPHVVPMNLAFRIFIMHTVDAVLFHQGDDVSEVMI